MGTIVFRTPVPNYRGRGVVMTADDFWLALIPPAMAMIVERCNPVSERALRKSAQSDFQHFNQDENHQILLDTVVRFSESAVEVAGLAPTLIACATSAFVILPEFPNPFWPSVIYGTVFLATALILIRLLSGSTFDQLHVQAITVKTRKMPWTAIRLVSYAIYVANALLIALDGFAFHRFGYIASAVH